MPIDLTDFVNPLGTFPIAHDDHLLGSYRSVADATARDLIPDERRKVGMLVRTNDTGETWVLGPGITNGDWTLSTFLSFLGEAQGDLIYRNATLWTRLAAGTTGQVLRTQGSGANPQWTDQIVVSGEAQGDLIYRNASTWTRLAAGTSGQVLRTQGSGANPQWTDQIVVSGEAQGDLIYRNATLWTRLAAGTSGQVLRTQGSGADPQWTDQIVVSGEAQGDLLYRNATLWTRLAAGTTGQVLHTQGSGADPQWANLYAKDILPNFGITSFTKTAPNSGTLLYRRGDTLTGITASLSYVSGPAESVGIANVFGGSTDVGDVDPGSWTCNSPFTSASLAGSVTRNGADAGADPTMTVVATATKTGFTSSVASWVVQWTSDIYWASLDDEVLAIFGDIYTSVFQNPGWNESLQVDRHRVVTFSGVNKYHWLWMPDEAQYTAGFNPLSSIIDLGTQLPFAMATTGTATHTRNGVTRTYRGYRSDQLSATFTVQI